MSFEIGVYSPVETVVTGSCITWQSLGQCFKIWNGEVGIMSYFRQIIVQQFSYFNLGGGQFGKRLTGGYGHNFVDCIPFVLCQKTLKKTVNKLNIKESVARLSK
eukprot:Gb_16360 [translate_table: standard]